MRQWLPSLWRATMMGSALTAAVNQSPVSGMRPATPTQHHSCSNKARRSKVKKLLGRVDLRRKGDRGGHVGDGGLERVQQIAGEHGHTIAILLEQEFPDFADAGTGQLVQKRNTSGAAWPWPVAPGTTTSVLRWDGGLAGSAGTTKATGTSSRTGSGAPTTAASNTDGMAGQHRLHLHN